MNKILRISETECFDKYINKIKLFLSDLVIEYPLHNKWFKGVVKDLKEKRYSREILFATNSMDEIIGVSILKRTNCEKKICTFRVAEKYQRQGIGTLLMLKSLEILETDKPIITVSESKHQEFKKLFQRFNFCLKKVYFGKYRYLTKEYCYNGVLSPETILKQDTIQPVCSSEKKIA